MSHSHDGFSGLHVLPWFRFSFLVCVFVTVCNKVSFVVLELFFSHLNLKFTYEFLLYDGDKNALLISVTMTLYFFFKQCI